MSATTDRDAFLRSIAHSPDDDAPRLVFADWLDEYGEPARAELIRVQCMAEALIPSDPRRKLLEMRADDLLPSLGSYRRGFLDLALVSGAEWAAELPRLVDIVPPVRVAVHDPSPDTMRTVAAMPELAQLRRLELSGGRLDPNDHAALVQLLMTCRLTELVLSLSTREPQTISSDLAHWPGLAHLRVLRLLGSFDSQFTVRLFASPHLTGLRELSILNSEPERLQLANVLSVWPGLPRLERLTVWFTSAGVLRTLLHANRTHALRELTATGYDVSTDACLELLASPNLPALRRLAITHLGSETPTTLATLPGPAPDAAPFESLSLRNLALGDEGVTWLARLPRLAGVSVLELMCCGVRLDGIRALTRSPFLTKVRRLNLGLNRFGPAGFKELAGSPTLAGLQSLNLMVTDPGVTGVQAMRRATWARSLVELNLSGNRLAKTAVHALRTAPFDSLRLLNLGHPDVAWDEFTGAEWFGRLEAIRLLGPLDNTQLRRLATLIGPALRSLEMEDCQFGASGLKSLTARHLPSLRRLDLRLTRIEGPGVRVLAGWPGLAHLGWLGLEHTGIGTQALDVLAVSPYLSKTCTLTITGERIRPATLDALRERVGRLVVQ